MPFSLSLSLQWSLLFVIYRDLLLSSLFFFSNPLRLLRLFSGNFPALSSSSPCPCPDVCCTPVVFALFCGWRLEDVGSELPLSLSSEQVGSFLPLAHSGHSLYPPPHLLPRCPLEKDDAEEEEEEDGRDKTKSNTKTRPKTSLEREEEERRGRRGQEEGEGGGQEEESIDDRVSMMVRSYPMNTLQLQHASLLHELQGLQQKVRDLYDVRVMTPSSSSSSPSSSSSSGQHLVLTTTGSSGGGGEEEKERLDEEEEEDEDQEEKGHGGGERKVGEGEAEVGAGGKNKKRTGMKFKKRREERGQREGRDEASEGEMTMMKIAVRQQISLCQKSFERTSRLTLLLDNELHSVRLSPESRKKEEQEEEEEERARTGARD